MSGLMRGGTAKSVSQDQIFRRGRGQGKIHFQVQRSSRLIPSLLYVMAIDT